MQTCISENAHELRKALLYHTAKPLDVDAYEMLGNNVVFSRKWAERKAQEFMISPTIARTHATKLINDVKEAINNLNALLPITPALGKVLRLHMTPEDVCAGWTMKESCMRTKEAYEFI